MQSASVIQHKIEELESSVQFLADNNIKLQKCLAQNKTIFDEMEERILILGKCIFWPNLFQIGTTLYLISLLEKKLDIETQSSETGMDQWKKDLIELLDQCVNFELRISILEDK